MGKLLDELEKKRYDERKAISAQIIPLQAKLELMLELQRTTQHPEKIISDLYRELNTLRTKYFDLLE